MGGPIGIVGVGNMGGAMAARLLSLGWPVRVCDLDPAKVQALEQQGAAAAGTPAEAAQGASAVIVCVVDSLQVEAVLFGPGGVASASDGGPPVVLLCPTIAPHDTERFAARLAQRGIAAIDAPMSGGPVRARDGTMSLMVACDEAVFDRHRDLVAALSGHVFRVGTRPGDGARTKLVNNLLAGINLVGAAEALALAARLGLDPARTLEVIAQSSGQSWIADDRMPRALAGDYAPRGHLSLLQKDTRLAVEAAQAAGFQGPLGAAARDVFARAAAQGMGALDDAAVFRLLSSS